jgi:hypothetical protein
MVQRLGWHALLLEPNPETFRWLQRNFGGSAVDEGRGVLRSPGGGQVRLVPRGVTPLGASHTATLHTISARVPELEGVYDRGLPRITRQRLQWGSSLDVKTARSVRGDLWLFNHLAGGPARPLGTIPSLARAFSKRCPVHLLRVRLTPLDAAHASGCGSRLWMRLTPLDAAHASGCGSRLWMRLKPLDAAHASGCGSRLWMRLTPLDAGVVPQGQ